jgi:phosphatidylglycerophosphate synthase
MKRTGPAEFFRQTLKSDSRHADEVINIYLLRPLAAVIVWFLYPTRATPNQVTVAAILAGLLAAGVYLVGTPVAIACGGLLVTAKDIIDDADGQLARAKQMYSRRGRFLDSIGDFVVDVALFGAITTTVYRTTNDSFDIVLGILAFLGITLRVSYHVYYQASYLHLEEKYKLNRIVEEVTDEDRRGDPVALKLQMVFNALYTWQDRLMILIDRWSGRGRVNQQNAGIWFGDRVGLRISGLMGFGTELALLTVCSLFNALHLYLCMNVLLMNGVWVTGILYRRMVVAERIREKGFGQ